jgi:hypothetical protein
MLRMARHVAGSGHAGPCYRAIRHVAGSGVAQHVTQQQPPQSALTRTKWKETLFRPLGPKETLGSWTGLLDRILDRPLGPDLGPDLGSKESWTGSLGSLPTGAAADAVPDNQRLLQRGGLARAPVLQSAAVPDKGSSNSSSMQPRQGRSCIKGRAGPSLSCLSWLGPCQASTDAPLIAPLYTSRPTRPA